MQLNIDKDKQEVKTPISKTELRKPKKGGKNTNNGVIFSNT